MKPNLSLIDHLFVIRGLLNFSIGNLKEWGVELTCHKNQGEQIEAETSLPGI